MKTFLISICVALAGLFSLGTAHAHPGHSYVERAAFFNHQGTNLNVWNTHRRGLFGAELIEIRDNRGKLYASWWTSRGWCFTEQSYSHNVCWSKGGYKELFVSRIKRFAAGHQSVGGTSYRADTTFCDHYSQLEYTVSGDTSGICGHQDHTVGMSG